MIVHTTGHFAGEGEFMCAGSITGKQKFTIIRSHTFNFTNNNRESNLFYLLHDCIWGPVLDVLQDKDVISFVGDYAKIGDGPTLVMNGNGTNGTVMAPVTVLSIEPIAPVRRTKALEVYIRGALRKRRDIGLQIDTLLQRNQSIMEENGEVRQSMFKMQQELSDLKREVAYHRALDAALNSNS